MTIHDWLRINQKELPEGESILLLSFVLKKEKAYILAHPERTFSREEGALLERCAERRKKHEPIAYITGEKEFFGLPFFVTEATLIPRPETEILVEYALETIADCRLQIAEKEKTISLIDIGTGSGCIPISIGKALQSTHPNIFSCTQFAAGDISKDAIAIARKNAVHHDIDRFIRFQESNLTTDIPESYFRTPFLILTANLPYLSKEIYEASPEDVRLYEPKNALQGDTGDGTALMRELLKQCQKKSPKSHLIILEISPEQSQSLLAQGKELFPQSEASILPDLSGRNRFLIIQNHPE